jgi:hypothetical protein
MKTLITTVAVLVLALTTVPAKEGAFTSVIIPDGGADLTLQLAAHQWMKITNFTQNDSEGAPGDLAGVAVFKGDNGLWVLFATKANVPGPHEDVIVAGPATVVVSPPKKEGKNGGATVFLTYQRRSD